MNKRSVFLPSMTLAEINKTKYRQCHNLSFTIRPKNWNFFGSCMDEDLNEVESMVLQEGSAFQDAQAWKSYSDTVGKHAIRSIPCLIIRNRPAY
jgi:hypothetical protein